MNGAATASSTCVDLSDEQHQCVDALVRGCNVVVDSVAGSGKTTTILGACLKLRVPTLVLTYNARLKDECRAKVEALGLAHVEVHSYHAFCVKYYDAQGYRDEGIARVVERDTRPLLPLRFELVLIDEAQDLTLTYYQLVRKILRDLLAEQPVGKPQQLGADPQFLTFAGTITSEDPGKVGSLSAPHPEHGSPRNKLQLGLLGDWMQSIYSFNDASEAYLQCADKGIFPEVGDRQWQRLTLSMSYRLTDQAAAFLNKCVLRQPRIKTCKSLSNCPVRYLICDAFKEPLALLSRYLQKNKYRPDEVYVLAPSLRTSRTPIRQLENALVQLGFPCYSPIDDATEVDERVTRGKIVFGSFHQIKGLERPLVVVFQFDESYFKFYARDANPYLVTNPMYVALTRAKRELVVVHDFRQEYCSFLDTRLLAQTCRVDTSRRSKSSTDKTEVGFQHRWTVTELLRHLPSNVIAEAVQRMLDYHHREASSEAKKRAVGPASPTSSCVPITASAPEPNCDAVPPRPPLERVPMDSDLPLLHLNGVVNVAGGFAETVADLYGLAVVALYEQRSLNQSCTILRETLAQSGALPAWHQRALAGLVQGTNGDGSSSGDRSDTKREPKQPTQQATGGGAVRMLRPRDLVYVANLYDSLTSGFIGRREQIKSYAWVDEDKMTVLADRIAQRVRSSSSGNKRGSKMQFEVPVERNVAGCVLSGRLDVVVEGVIWELKCTRSLDSEHVLQTLCYQWLAAPTIRNHDTKLYNVCTDKTIELPPAPATLDRRTEVLEYLIRMKNQSYKPRLPPEVLRILS